MKIKLKLLFKRLKRKLMLVKSRVVIPTDGVYYNKSFSSFTDLLIYAENIKDLNEARHAMHCIFQGVYDLLQNHTIPAIEELYDRIVRTGIDFYSSFYLGQGKIETVTNLLPSLQILKNYDDDYRYKSRGNFGSLVEASNVAYYLQEAGDSVNYDTIIGIAASASEPAMALAGITGNELQFIRYSKRRSDDRVTVLDFKAEEIAQSINLKSVLVIDDCVQYGVSMTKAMDYVRSLGALKIWGSCIYNDNPNDLNQITSTENFHLYE
jgi:orotate phosphoribosyltransferase-like protein